MEKIGSRTEPWGTPHTIASSWYITLFRDTNCDQFLRYDIQKYLLSKNDEI